MTATPDSNGDSKEVSEEEPALSFARFQTTAILEDIELEFTGYPDPDHAVKLSVGGYGDINGAIFMDADRAEELAEDLEEAIVTAREADDA